MSYDPLSVMRQFDTFGDEEWQRLVASPLNEVGLHIHTHYLKKHIRPGMYLLEIGAGAGRFTYVLAQLGARLVVADLSPVQLELNRRHTTELGCAGAVEEWAQVDICDLARYATGSFDAVVAYGGPLSYVLDRRAEALAECLRVVRPGGVLLLSVMCLWGSARRHLQGVINGTPPEVNRRLIATGDISPATFPGRRDNYMHLFRSAELRAWLEGAGLRLLDLSASGVLSGGWEELLAGIRSDPLKWADLLEMELEASCQPGSLDLGTHLVAAAQIPG